MIAAIMCGGSGSRMQSFRQVEKPLLRIKGITLAKNTFNALANSEKFERIIAVTSPKAPQTQKFLHKIGADIIKAPGAGYSKDLSLLLDIIGPCKVLVIPADLPLLDTKSVNDILTLFLLNEFTSPSSIRPPSMATSIIMDKGFVESVGARPSIIIKIGTRKFCHSGITLFHITRSLREKSSKGLNEQYVVMNRVSIAINANTKEDLELAEKLLVQYA